jgi:RNA polymerase sigma factor (sigma-70 family)
MSAAATTLVPDPLAGRTDAELVLAARKGDFAAFSALHRRYSPVLYRRLSRLVGTGPDVDDVIQEVFLQLHLSLDRYDPSRPLINWLQRIARNVAFSHLRKRPAELDPIGLAGLHCSQDEWRRLSSRDRLRLLDAVLNQMSPEARDAFVMFAVEGLTLAEIAEICDEPLNTIAARVRRARERLVLALRNREPHEINPEREP